MDISEFILSVEDRLSFNTWASCLGHGGTWASCLGHGGTWASCLGHGGTFNLSCVVERSC